jgi:ubiquinone/menaquinone biosynthesis C-methylase UbiE
VKAVAGIVDERMRAYYDRRAEEYDDWWLGRGLFAERDRPGWDDELGRLTELLEELPPARVIDVACGTGFLTRHLNGDVVALDQSPAMLEVAAERLPAAELVQADAASLPFADGEFDRAFTSHFYGHLLPREREAALDEMRRVAHELIVVDSARRDGVAAEEWQERVLDDGSTHRVYKRYFSSGSELADELGGGHVLLAGRWFVVVAA